MTVRVIYAATYEFAPPAVDLHLQCRLQPLPRPGQIIRSARVSTYPEPGGWRRTSQAGNVCDHALFAAPINRLQISADLQVCVKQPLRLPRIRPAKADLRIEQGILIPAVSSTRSELQALIEHASRHWTYDDTTWDPSIPVADLADRQHGACEDLARVCVEVLRGAGIPARFIVGYLGSADPARHRLRRRHAWFAGWTQDSGWHECDPLNETLLGPRIATAWGPVLAALQPVEGSFTQGQVARVAVDVQVLTDA